MNTYDSFLDSKHVRPKLVGFEPGPVNAKCFPFQADIIRWACRKGQAALWEDCGLGKTLQELEIARLATEHCRSKGNSGRAILLTPLAVAAQIKRESDKFEIQADVKIVKDQSQATAQINVTNYERLHLFDLAAFDVVVCDESSILRNFVGKTKQALCAGFRHTPYRFCGTATPAPNDRMELGNHSDFLGIMPSNEMLARWFINDSMKSGGYILRPFAHTDFWTWIASWAVCIGRPSDIGHDDNGYVLPPLEVIEHVVNGDWGLGAGDSKKVTATTIHQEKRACLKERVAVVADLVHGDDDYWVVWCDTDYEADALLNAIPKAIEVRGSHPVKVKEERLEAFSTGRERVIITKPDIGGLGLNWQHAHKTTWFAGYSYQDWYQSIRRLYRFGQTHRVECHLVLSENEQSIKDVLSAKGQLHREMFCEMAQLMKPAMLDELYGKRVLQKYSASESVRLPEWMIGV
jgi:hypothetical protein